jgi:hypothetical protein
MADIDKLLKRKDKSKLFDQVREENKPKLNVNRLISRRNQAKADLDKWRSLLESAYHYAMPDYNPFENYGRGGQLSPGQQYDADIYDLTLPIAHQRLADKMLMGLTPQGQQWMKFKPGDDFGDPAGQDYQRALEATQRMTDQFFKILDRSNFYLALSESLNDCLISTGVMVINEGTRQKPLRFEAATASQVMLEGNADGGVDAVFRDWYSVRVENIKALWPDAKLEQLQKEKDDKINLWECSYIDYEAPESQRYKYVLLTTNREVLVEKASSSWPWVVFRMRKMAGEVRGRGPSLRAYPTAATINEALGDELIAAAFTANPMYMAASDSAFNQDTFTAKPGAIIPVQMVMGQWPIQQFPGGGNINFSALLVNDFRQQINELLFAFPLGSVNAPDRTATEVSIRSAENLESFSAMVPRLQNEFFEPVIKRCLWVINKVLPETFGNIEPELRNRLLSVDGQLIDLTFETPLMTERGQLKTQSLLNFYQALASMVGPEAATSMLDVPNVVNHLAENQGVELNNIKSQQEQQQIVQATGEMATQYAEQEGYDVE